MKSPRFLVLILAALFALLAPRPAEARTEVSFDFFYDSLEPYGEWVQVADYGYCWRPTDVDREWAPYSDGYWAFTDAGWTWVSYEDYGGIVYHYGRWVRVEDEGWCWVPDYEWGPAWVSWRNNDDYVGWAPLPPEARWRPSIGISIWADRDYDIGPANYNFCRVGDFGAPVLRPVIINRIENVTIVRRTVNITNITYNTTYVGGPVIYNGGPNYTIINQRSNRRVPALKLVQNVNIDLGGMRDMPRGDHRRNFNGQAVGNQLIVTAPVVKPPIDPAFLKPKVSKVFAAEKVTRGWNGVKNDEVRKELRQEMQRQTKGLTAETTPARAVAVSDLKVLPEKADPQAVSPVSTREQRERPDKKGRNPEVAAQPPITPPVTKVPTEKPVAETTIPPTGNDRPNGNAAREKMRNPEKPVAVDSGLKPFNPVTEPEQKNRKPKPPVAVTPDVVTETPPTTKSVDSPTKMRDAERQAEMIRQRQQQQAEAQQQKALADQEKAARKQAAEAAAQQRQQMEAQRQAEILRQQQKEEAAANRQRMQAEQGRAARQQAEAAAAQQQKQQENMLRRQQSEQQAAEQQQRRQMMEQQRAAEQGRRAQEAQREQMRQQNELQRQQRVQPAPNAPPSATPAETDERRGKKKNKDN